MAASSQDVNRESYQFVDDHDTVEESQAPKKRKLSEVWNHFSINKDNNDKSSAVCNYCAKTYTYHGSRYGTSTLNRHLEKCKKKPQFIEGKLVVRGTTIDQKVCRDLIAKVTIAHDLPFNWVEYKEMRVFLKYLNEDLQFITRNTVSSDVYKVYEIEKEKLKLTLKNTPGMVCLTSDVWTACTTVGYMCLSAHYVDEKWKLNSKLLAFCALPPPHSALELALRVYDCLSDWEIDSKVFSLTLDNASANNSMVKMLQERLQLQNSLICNGEYFHVRCSAHILNLIVQEGLKVANKALDKIRASVKYIRGAEGRSIKFRECAKKVGMEITTLLLLDVPTRWNSTYLMLASAVKYQSVFRMMAFDDLTFKNWPTDDDWKRGKQMSDFLHPFYKITNAISGSSYPTSNLYFIELWKIQCLLEKNSLSDDELVRDMSCNMKAKFDKYWETYSEILSMGAVFDPRLKLKTLEFCFSKLDPTSSQEKVRNLRTKLHLLYDEYKKRDVASSSQAPSSQLGETDIRGAKERKKKEGAVDFGPFDYDYKSYKKRSVNDEISPLDKYLEEDQCDEDSGIDVLKFWKNKESTFGPVLARMACDVLSIPITTVFSESSFSIGAHVLTKYRNRLLPEKVQALLCTRNWLHGYPDGAEDSEDEIENEGEDTEEASNVVESFSIP